MSCIQSVFHTFHAHCRDTEFVFIDDCSDLQHEIQPIFQGFRDSLQAEVRIFRARRQKHYAAGLALGLSQCRGDMVLFLSNDMMVTPGYVNTLVKVAVKNTRSALPAGP